MVQIAKIALYKITAAASKITDPCVLNKTFLVGFLLIATAGFNYYIGAIFNFNIAESIITAEFLHSSLSFAVIFFAAIGLFVTFSQPFKFSISASSPCILFVLACLKNNYQLVLVSLLFINGISASLVLNAEVYLVRSLRIFWLVWLAV